MALTSYQALHFHHTKPACTMEAATDKHIPRPAQHADKHMAANAARPHHMSSTDTVPEQEGTFRALYMAMTKTKPPHDSPHTTPSLNNNKPRQMICSKAHQGGTNKTPKWIITHKDPPKPPSITFADLYRARARAAAGEPPEAVTVPVINPKPQWQVVHMGWGNPKSNIEPSNPKHPNYSAPSPDNNPSTPPPPALQEAWLEPQPGYLFGQSAHQSTDDEDESNQDVTYDVYNLEEDDTYKDGPY
jgi:hypothetical protein